jgi:hypothetical protein
MAEIKSQKGQVDAWLRRAGPIAGSVLIGAFGDGVVVGALIGLMDDITPFDCYTIIKNGEHILPDEAVDEEDWGKIREFVHKARLEHLTDDKLDKAFRKYRPDLASIVLNHPRGKDWWYGETARIRERLGLTT